MNRLRDMEGDELLFRRGVEMIRRTPPTPQAPDLKLRVWRSLQRAPASSPHGLRILMFKLAVVVILALVAGTAGAVIARRWIAPARGGVPASAGAALAPSAMRPATTTPIPALPALPAAPAADAIVESPAPKPLPRNAPRKLVSPAPSAASVARERTEVLDALVALRREHDPARAGTLLARYLLAHPRGALREEALALAIEAADARGDRAAGELLSKTYEDEFPAGRFMPFVRSHTDGPGSH